MAVVVTAVSTTDTSTMTELARPVHEKATSAASCHVNVLGPKVLEEKVLGPKSTESESESESRWIWTQAQTQNTDIIKGVSNTRRKKKKSNSKMEPQIFPEIHLKKN